MLASSLASLGLYATAGNLYPEVTSWAGANQGSVAKNKESVHGCDGSNQAV